MDGFQQPQPPRQQSHPHTQQHQAWLLDYQYYPNNVNSRSLSLNVSSLSVASPLSPVGGHGQGSPFSFEPPSHPQAHPASGSTSPINHAGGRHFDDHGHAVPSSANTAFDIKRGTPQSSRPPSNAGLANASTSPTVSTSSQLPRKRSFTAHPNLSSASINSPIAPAASGGGASSLNGASTAHSASSSTIMGVSGLGLSSVNVHIGTPLVEVDAEHEADDGNGLYDDDSMDMVDSSGHASACTGSGSASTSTGGGGNSPIDGSPSSTEGGLPCPTQSTGSVGGGMGATMGVIGKPMATNNFVTKLYQMINDSKSGQFITWTELGTSFVVSNVGEFSRSILGSHFKHNNFSSFVRQLNMYGFHKINRTPRAQRTSTDAQTWEFSHHKFLRGRPDLLDEIKRKALEPDPAIKHRIELPGELASQLNMMKDEVRRCSGELAFERRKVDRLTKALCQLWDSVAKAFPIPPIPLDLLDSSESPNIYVTSPTSSNVPRFAPPPLSMNGMNLHTIHGVSSPTSSPTTTDFPFSHAHHVSHHGHVTGGHPHPLSRQHSFHHQQNGMSISGRTDRSSTSSTPLASSPSPGSLSTSISMDMDLYDDGSCDPPPVSGREGAKRQRLDESLDATGGGLGLSIGVNSQGHGPGSSGSSESNLGLMSSVSSPGAGPTGPGLNGLTVPKKGSMRARSDSAPMGYASGGGLGLHSPWAHPHCLSSGQPHPLGAGPGMNGHSISGRPRSGSGMMPPRIAIPSVNIGLGRGPGSAGVSGNPMLAMSHGQGHVGR